MANVRVRWGRIFFAMLTTTSLLGWATYDHWKDRLVGTPLEGAPALLAQAISWAESQVLTLAEAQRDPVPKLADFFPADTAALFVLRDLEQAGRTFSKLAGDENDLLARQSQEKLGTDFTSAQALAESGFDFRLPWAVGMIPGKVEQALTFLAVAPVVDGDAALRTLTRQLEQQGYAPARQEVQGITAYTLLPDAACALIGGDHLACALVSDASLDPVQTLVNLERGLPSPSLASSTYFQRMLEVQEHTWLGLLFAARPGLEQGLAQAGQPEAGALRDELPLAISAALLIDDHQIRVRTALTEPAREWKHLLLDRGGDDGLAEHLSGTALAVARLHLDIQALLDYVNSDPALAQRWEDFKRETQPFGPLLESELLKNLDGNFAGAALLEKSRLKLELGSFQGALATLAQALGDQVQELVPVGIVAWAGVRDEARVRGALEAIAAQMSARGIPLEAERDAQGLWYGVPRGGIALTRGHLVISAGPGGLAALRERLTDSGPSVLASLPEDVRKGWQARRPAWFYVDTRNSLEAAASSPWFQALTLTPPASTAREALQETVRGLSATTSLESDMILTDYVLHGPEEGFEARAERVRSVFKSGGG